MWNFDIFQFLCNLCLASRKESGMRGALGVANILNSNMIGWIKCPSSLHIFEQFTKTSTVCSISGNSVVLNLYFDFPHIRKS